MTKSLFMKTVVLSAAALTLMAGAALPTMASAQDRYSGDGRDTGYASTTYERHGHHDWQQRSGERGGYAGYGEHRGRDRSYGYQTNGYGENSYGRDRGHREWRDHHAYRHLGYRGGYGDHREYHSHNW